MSKKVQKVCFLTQKLRVKTLECTEQINKIWIPQGGEPASCSVYLSFNVNSAQKEANFRDIYPHEKSGLNRRDLSIGVWLDWFQNFRIDPIDKIKIFYIKLYFYHIW